MIYGNRTASNIKRLPGILYVRCDFRKLFLSCTDFQAGAFLCHVFTDGSLILSFVSNFYIPSTAKFSTSLLTCLFIYNRLLRKIYGPERKDQNTREEYTMTSFTICSPHKIIYDQINEDEMEAACGM